MLPQITLQGANIDYWSWL